jgi:hypothetical protein
MKRSGSTDLPLHYGTVPKWLSQRMSRLGGLIIEALVQNFGKKEVVRRLSDPLWFQSLGAALGMDWHSSGITTSVVGALKKAVNPISRELGIYICGGRGKHSRKTPEELLAVSHKTGLDGNKLVEASRLSAKIDNTAVQDGFQLYLHSFVLTDEGDWTVIQQGMNTGSRLARRYHWHSGSLKSFVEEPHSGVVGENQGLILNLTHREADPTRSSLVEIAKESPLRMMKEIQKIAMPRHHEVKAKDVNLKRLGAVLATAHSAEVRDFASLLLTQGLGPRTLQSLVLVSEVIFGTPSRFNDPARFSFAHGGKDGHPFPVPLKVYDKTISTLKQAVNQAKMGNTDKIKCIGKLDEISRNIERNYSPEADFDRVIRKERENSWKYGGRTVFGKAQPPKNIQKDDDPYHLF